MSAVVLLSGGVDSTVILAMAIQNQKKCLAISFDYGQRHRIELDSAKKIAAYYGVSHKIITIDSACFKGSALVSNEVLSASIAKNRSKEMSKSQGVPNTYVPARNSIFLAFAMGQAELIGAEEIYAGPILLDREPYPDCRPEFYRAFQEVINTGTKQSQVGAPPKLLTPLIEWDKKKIVEEGIRLKAPLDLTFSCYDPQDDKPCGACDACVLRKEAFQI